MRTASVVLLLLVALVLGFLVSVAVANELQTAVRDNPNTPRDDALARGI